MAPPPRPRRARPATSSGPPAARVVVYTSGSSVWPLRRLAAAARGDLRRSFTLGRHLFARSLRSAYRRTALRYAWILVPPAVTTSLWVFLSASGVVRFESLGVPYAAYVGVGLVLWQSFAESVRMPLRMLGESAATLTRVRVPPEALLLAGLGDVLLRLAVRSLVLAVLLAALGVAPRASLLLAPAGAVLLILLGVGLGLVLAPVGALYRDVEHALGPLLQVWLYLTPVVYPTPDACPACLINVLNPVSPLLIAARDWVLGGGSARGVAFGAAALSAVVLVALGTVLLRAAMPYVVERLGS